MPSSDAAAASTASPASSEGDPSRSTDRAAPTWSAAAEPSPTRSPGAVTPVLASVAVDAATATLQLSGYVEGVVADGLTCTFRVTSGQDVVEASSVSLADATVTACPWVEIPLSAVHEGTWSARLLLLDSGAGSESVTVDVP